MEYMHACTGMPIHLRRGRKTVMVGFDKLPEYCPNCHEPLQIRRRDEWLRHMQIRDRVTIRHGSKRIHGSVQSITRSGQFAVVTDDGTLLRFTKYGKQIGSEFAYCNRPVAYPEDIG